MQVSSFSQQYITNKNNSTAPNFGSKPSSKFFAPLKKITTPLKNEYENVTDEMAQMFGSILESKPVESIIKKTAGSNHMRENLFVHLTAFTSIVLSGFYVKKTLDNKDLDEKRKRTLAINQAAVTVFSTGSAYFLDKKIDKKWKEFSGKILDNVKANDSKHFADFGKHYSEGLKMMKSAVIFGMINRFIGPVFMTPVANAIGNHVNEKKAAEAKQKSLLATA